MMDVHLGGISGQIYTYCVLPLIRLTTFMRKLTVASQHPGTMMVHLGSVMQSNKYARSPKISSIVKRKGKRETGKQSQINKTICDHGTHLN